MRPNHQPDKNPRKKLELWSSYAVVAPLFSCTKKFTAISSQWFSRTLLLKDYRRFKDRCQDVTRPSNLKKSSWKEKQLITSSPRPTTNWKLWMLLTIYPTKLAPNARKSFSMRNPWLSNPWTLKFSRNFEPIANWRSICLSLTTNLIFKIKGLNRR